jgi:hypothetical protein
MLLELEKIDDHFWGKIMGKKNKPDEAELVTENEEAPVAGLANAPGRGLVSD